MVKNIYIRSTIFVLASILFYLIWSNGGERVYGKIVAGGVNKITTRFSSIQKSEYKYFEDQEKSVMFFFYKDRQNNISTEYCLPVVLLLAWHLSLFFDKRLIAKKALKYFAINFSIIYFLQIIFPLLLYNISQSKTKSMSLFIGLQIFSFIVFFLIIKDSLLIKYNNSMNNSNIGTNDRVLNTKKN